MTDNSDHVEPVLLDDDEIERRYRLIYESYTPDELDQQRAAARRRAPSWKDEG